MNLIRTECLMIEKRQRQGAEDSGMCRVQCGMWNSEKQLVLFSSLYISERPMLLEVQVVTSVTEG